MTKTNECELELGELDMILGGSAGAVSYVNPATAVAATSMTQGFHPIYVTPTSANNYGLANHFHLSFPGMASAADAAASAVAPTTATATTGHHHHHHHGQDSHAAPAASSSTDDPNAAASNADPLSLAPPSTTTDASATAAIPASSAAVYLGFPGQADLTVAPQDAVATDAGHAAGATDWGQVPVGYATAGTGSAGSSGSSGASW
jgi:hypothetical protein